MKTKKKTQSELYLPIRIHYQINGQWEALTKNYVKLMCTFFSFANLHVAETFCYFFLNWGLIF